MDVMQGLSKKNLAQKLYDYFVLQEQFEPIELAIIQPASLFLEFMENRYIRHMIRFTDNGGRSLCLRPDFTIPVSQHYIQVEKQHACYFYQGNTFQQRSTDSHMMDLVETYAYGIEIYTSDKNTLNQDASLIELAMNCLEKLGFQRKNLTIHIADVSLMQHMIECLLVNEPVKEHLRHVIERHGHYSAITDDTKKRLSQNRDKNKIHNVEKQLSDLADDAVIIGQRSVDDIRQRLKEKALYAVTPIVSDIWQFMDEIVSLNKGVIDSIKAMKNIQKRYQHIVDLEPFLVSITQQVEAFKTCGLLLDNIQFKTESSTKFCYYDMFVFEIYYHDMQECLCRGGRYDSLFSHMQSKEYVSACGFSLFSETLLSKLKTETCIHEKKRSEENHE